VKGCGNPADFIQILVDENEIWRQNVSGIHCWQTDYRRHEVDLSAFADGNSHNLKIYSQQTTSATTNFFLDDLTLWQETDWLQIEPDSGSLPGGSTILLHLTVNSEGLLPGMHRAVLELHSGDEILTQILVEVKINAPYQYYFPLIGNAGR